MEDTVENNGIDTSSPIGFSVPLSLLNLHMLAQPTPKDGKTTLEMMKFIHKDGALNIFTTNGRILFHTILPDEVAYIKNQGDWDFSVKFPGKFKTSTKCNFLMPFELTGDILTATTPNGQLMFRISNDEYDGKYPNCWDVEVKEGVEPTAWQPFNPKYMEYVVEYLGGVENTPIPIVPKKPEHVPEDATPRYWEKPYQFEMTKSDGIIYRAVIMPLATK